MHFAELQSVHGTGGLGCGGGKVKDSIAKFLKKTNLAEPAKSAVCIVGSYHPRAIRQRRRMMSFYRQFIREGDLCFDVGANIGNRTEVFLKLGASVVAIEPQADCMKGLQRKFGRNANVTLLQKGLGEKPGQKELLATRIRFPPSRKSGYPR